MARFRLLLLVLFLIMALTTGAAGEKKISLADLRDHIMGGWVGQGVGVSTGAPHEFRSCAKIDEREIRPWKPEHLAESLGQDDLYVDMTFIAALEAYGPGITYEQAGYAFAASLYQLWHANDSGRENVRKGIMPPMSGHPKYNPHADDIDFQIEADGIGLVSPGLPQACNDLCDIFGHVMNYGDGVYGGMWVASMYSQAFFEPDPAKLVSLGLASVPSESRFAQCIADIIKWHEQYPTDWRKTWQEVEKKWQDNIDCMPKAPHNIDAKLNAAYIAIALLYGGGDFDKTMEIAVRCGQDSDCNTASAAGVLGCAMGLSKMPEQYKSYLPQMAGRKFSYTSYSYDTIGKATLSIARAVIEKAGGKTVKEGDTEYALIPDQSPKPPATLEQWSEAAQKETWK